ncbi:MAG: exo-alpha-sialidase [Planctomycetes bacterium]|nr:exo-alpha-sialidase [Planctomycetota bacterium]
MPFITGSRIQRWSFKGVRGRETILREVDNGYDNSYLTSSPLTLGKFEWTESGETCKRYMGGIFSFGYNDKFAYVNTDLTDPDTYPMVRSTVELHSSATRHRGVMAITESGTAACGLLDDYNGSESAVFRIVRSTDRGENYSLVPEANQPQTLVEAEVDAVIAANHGGGYVDYNDRFFSPMFCWPDGTVVCVMQTYLSWSEVGVEPYAWRTYWLLRSTDCGATWSCTEWTAAVINAWHNESVRPELCWSGMITYPDQRITAYDGDSCYRAYYRSYEQPVMPYIYEVGLLITHDKGATWTRTVLVSQEWLVTPPEIINVTHITDGVILVTLTDNTRTGNEVFRMFVTEDSGTSWSELSALPDFDVIPSEWTQNWLDYHGWHPRCLRAYRLKGNKVFIVQNNVGSNDVTYPPTRDVRWMMEYIPDGSTLADRFTVTGPVWISNNDLTTSIPTPIREEMHTEI